MGIVGIIGSSGFIGSHLASRYKNVRRYGRENISKLSGDDSDLIIIAAAPASKWLANKEPEKDLANIKTLVESLKCIEDKKCVLISTIDVFPVGTEFIESQELPFNHPEAYGANRGYLEMQLTHSLENLHIVRLPGMFGPGLKKNLIYDLLNGKPTTKMNPATSFQFYDVRSLPGHLGLCIASDLKISNLATEPITVSEIYSSCFDLHAPLTEVPEMHYRMKTKFSNELAGLEGPYISSKIEVLAGLKQWISRANK